MFSGNVIPKRKVYEKETFRIYAVEPEKPYMFMNQESFSILGDMPDLVIGSPYAVVAEAKAPTKYGISFKIKSIAPNITNENRETFYQGYLKAIVTERQADAILSVYPNFVNLILEGKMNEIDVKLLYGVGQKSLETISSRIKSQVAIMDVMEEYGEYEISFKLAGNMLAKCNMSMDLLREKMQKNPYGLLCSIEGIGFKRADVVIMKIRPELVSDMYRLHEAAKYVIAENESSGSSYMPFANLYKVLYGLVPEAIQHTKTLIESNEGLYYDEENNRIGLASTRANEVYIAKKLIEIRDNKNIKTYWGKEPDFESFRVIDGKYSLSDEQMQTISSVFHNNVTILYGSAGMGKSSSTKGVVTMLSWMNKSFKLLAPTGAAGQQLSRFTGCEASTIHREIIGNEMACQGSDNEPVIEADVVIIDEISMLDISLFARTLRQISLERGTKLILIGDPEQIASIGAGRISYDIKMSEVFSTINLTKVFRYGEGGLMKVATDIREQRNYINYDGDKVTTYGTNKDYMTIKSLKSEMLKEIGQLYANLMKQGFNTMEIGVISPMNIHALGSIEINQMIQSIVIPKDAPSIKFGDKTFKLGDKVVNLKNNYRMPSVSKLFYEDDEDNWLGLSPKVMETMVFNGNQGIIVEVSEPEEKDKFITVKYENELILYRSENFDMLGHAYCLSVHKYQGSSAKQIILVTCKSHTHMLNKNLLYTACTRSSERTFHFIEDVNTINLAINKSENQRRDTYLCELLLEKDKVLLDK